MNKYSFVLAVLIIALIASCKKENKTPVPQTIDTLTAQKSLKNIYYSMPAPMELASLIKNSKNDFSIDYLNDVNNANNYETTEAMAMNLGIYSADLGFLSIMQQTQYTNQYFNTVIKLADKLGIKEGLNDTLLQQIRDNLNNIDELKKLTAKAFFKADAFLKENDMETISTQIINGSWIESIYILTRIYQSNKNENILHLLLDQRLVVDNILKLDSLYLQNKNLIDQLSSLKQLFNNSVVLSKKETYDSIADTMRIKTFVKYDADDKKLEKIFNKIIKIRKNLVSLH